jgi:hypothetical protein
MTKATGRAPAAVPGFGLRASVISFVIRHSDFVIPDPPARPGRPRRRGGGAAVAGVVQDHRRDQGPQQVVDDLGAVLADVDGVEPELLVQVLLHGEHPLDSPGPGRRLAPRGAGRAAPGGRSGLGRRAGRPVRLARAVRLPPLELRLGHRRPDQPRAALRARDPPASRPAHRSTSPLPRRIRATPFDAASCPRTRSVPSPRARTPRPPRGRPPRRARPGRSGPGGCPGRTPRGT